MNATSKLVKAWESKNAKNAAKAGGVSLMALSLAACGGSDTTITQADLDAQTAAATAAAAAQAAAEAEAAAAAAAQAAAEADAATAAEAQAAAEAAQAAAEAEAAAAAVAQAAAEAAQAAAEAEAAAATAPVSASLQAVATADTLVGSAGNDTFSGSGAAIDDDDQIIDSSSSDADVLNLTVTASSSTDPLQVTNVETINYDIQALTATMTVNTADIKANTALNISRTDPTISGTTLNGGDNVTVSNVDVDNTPVINITTAIVDLTVGFDGYTEDGVVITADTMTGDVDINDGAATLNAAATTGDIAIDDENTTNDNTTAVVVNAANASDIDVGQAQAFEGSVTVNAAAADTVEVATSGAQTINAATANDVDVDDATGGATVTAGVSNTDDTVITLVNVDATGATITTGTGVAASATGKQIDIDIDGTALATDTITIKAAGVISLDQDKGNGGVVDILNLQGNDAEVTYDFDSTDAVAEINGSGANDVNVILSAAVVEGAEVTGISEMTLDADGSSDAANDLDEVSVGKFIVTADFGTDGDAGEDEMTLLAGQTVEFKTDQTLVDIDVAGTSTDSVSIIAGDVNGTATTVGTLSLGAVSTTEATANSATTGATTAGTVTITANESNVTIAGLTAWSQNVVISGDENVTLSTAATTSTAAQSIDATELTGNLTVTIADNGGGTAADTGTLNAGAGDDNIDIETGTIAVAVDAGAGDDTITLTSVGALATINANEGDDTIEMDEDATAYVVIGGAGDDTYDFGSETSMDATIVDASGSDDTLVIGANHDSSGAELALSGIDVFEMGSNNLTLNDNQFGNNNAVKIEGSGTLTVNARSGKAATIDASDVTMTSSHTVSIVLSGDSKADAITGGGENETIDGAGGADTLDGGAGTDVLDVSTLYNVTETGSAAASTGVVVNMGNTAVSSTTVFSNVADYTAGGIASVASGEAVYLYAANSTGNAATVDTFANFENVTGSTGADYIIGDAAANVITGGDGADYITTGSGADTVVIADTGAGNDTVSDFTAGTGGDVVRFDLSGAEEDAAGNADVDLINIDLGTSSVAAADSVVLSAITGATDMAAITTDTTILVANLAANIADAATLETALEDSGNLEITADAAIAAKDGFLVAFDDGTNSYLAHVESAAGATDDGTFASGDLTATVVATLSGVDDVTDLVAANFELIA